jgi:preprotein translocase subunit SecG
MATDDYSNGNELHHMRRDARDAHSNSTLAKWMSILALLTAAIALAVAVMAMNKAGEAQSTANRATERLDIIQTQ